MATSPGEQLAGYLCTSSSSVRAPAIQRWCSFTAADGVFWQSRSEGAEPLPVFRVGDPQMTIVRRSPEGDDGGTEEIVIQRHRHVAPLSARSQGDADGSIIASHLKQALAHADAERFKEAAEEQ